MLLYNTKLGLAMPLNQNGNNSKITKTNKQTKSKQANKTNFLQHF